MSSRACGGPSLDTRYEKATMDERFTATLEKSPNPGGWTYIVWPQSVD